MRRLIKIFLYQFSHSKKQLDTYMKVIRKGNTLSEGEVTKLRNLIDNEKQIYGKIS